MKAFVIIPGYNEEKNIVSVIKDAKKYSRNITVVDDGSKDRTYDVSRKTGVMVLRHMINLGKGAALKTGSRYAFMQGADAVIFLDSDGQHDPKEIPRLAKEAKDVDVVFTYRIRRNTHMPLTMQFGNWVLSTLLALLFRIRVRDSQCGYKILTKKAFSRLNLISNDYNIESEIVAKTGKYGLKFRQMPIDTIYKDKYKGTTVFDGVQIAMRMLWWKLAK